MNPPHVIPFALLLVTSCFAFPHSATDSMETEASSETNDTPTSSTTAPPPSCTTAGIVDAENQETCEQGKDKNGDVVPCNNDYCNYCGDGTVNNKNPPSIRETCEDDKDEYGKTVACSANCTFCGDDNVDTTQNETCDNNHDDKGNPVANCRTDCTYCGDGKPDLPSEACDLGANNNAPIYTPSAPAPGTCPANCVRAQFCGDLEVNGPETCEDFKDSAGNPVPNCTPDCNYCGDDKTDPGESCDDGTKNITGTYNPSMMACTDNCAYVAEYCGDGIPNGPEVCDDGNNVDGDGCSADCKIIEERRVFVSSVAYKGNLSKSPNDTDEGITLANNRCNTLAMTAMLAGKYKAWLSDATQSPSTRFQTEFTGIYRLASAPNNPPGVIIATGWSDLTKGTLAFPINATEVGAPVPVDEEVWTNTSTKGEPTDTKLSANCNNWKDGTMMNNATSSIGNASVTSSSWTEASSGNCNGTRRIYCFEDYKP